MSSTAALIDAVGAPDAHAPHIGALITRIHDKGFAISTFTERPKHIGFEPEGCFLQFNEPKTLYIPLGKHWDILAALIHELGHMVQGPSVLKKSERDYTVGDWCVRCEREREAWDLGWTEANVLLPGYETDFQRYRDYCMDRYWDAARTAARK